MIEFIVHLVVTALLLLVVANVVKGITIQGFGTAFLSALVLGILNATVWWVAVVMSLPVIVLTAGLFIFILNALMLWLMSAIVPGVKIDKFSSALLGSLLLTALNIVVGWIAR